jgi:hypothetical protein
LNTWLSLVVEVVLDRQTQTLLEEVEVLAVSSQVLDLALPQAQITP